MIDFSWRVGGEAGYGIDTAGTLFARICMKHGLHVCGNREYPSLIRGGHNNFTIRFSSNELTSHESKINVIAALNERTITEESPDLIKGGVIIHDNDVKPKIAGAKLISVGLNEIAGKHGDAKLMMNIVIIGASAGIIGFNKEKCIEVITNFFSRKGEAIAKANADAFSEGYTLMSKEKKMLIIPDIKPVAKMLITGNAAFSIGSLRAGCNFISAYPMTPATTIMEYLFTKASEYGVRCLQSEDEINAINAAVGAGYAGARALTCTSGGGFALMTEGISLAGMSETPVVIALSQRPGPATGLPTRTAQGDLGFALNAGHGEFSKIILAPGDINECYSMALDAFNYAEKYQTPVIVMLDKHLSEGIHCIKPFSDKYVLNRGELLTNVTKSLPSLHKFKRYAITSSGISPRPVPGIKNGLNCSIGDEHDDEGFIIESEKQAQVMADKRLRKNKLIIKNLSKGVNVYGTGSLVLVGWGSTKGALLEAASKLKAKFVQVKILSPFPTIELKKLLKGRVIVVENNRDGELARLIKENLLFVPKQVNKYNGRAFTPEEIVSEVKKVIKKK